MAKKDKTPAAKAAPAAATAPAEQQGNLPAGSTDTATQTQAATGDQAAALITEQTTQAPGADAAPTVVDPTASTTGQDAQPIQGGHSVEDSAADSATDEDRNTEIDALWVESRPESFRRCGFRFTREGVGIALVALTSGQLATLESDPNLVTERCSFLDKVRG